jgi:hypothetical protein
MVMIFLIYCDTKNELSVYWERELKNDITAAAHTTAAVAR